MIRFTCPRCDAALKAPDDRAGEKINCPECQRAVDVPESLDESPAAESDASRRRRVPLWVWGAAAFALLALAVGVVIGFVTSGPDDGLTRPQRRELEAKVKAHLPGTWEVTSTGLSGYEGFYAFGEDGTYKAFKFADGRRVERFVGTWVVSGSTLTLKVTESADDRVSGGAAHAWRVSDLKSQDGKVFKFTAAWADPGRTHFSQLTFAKQLEPSPAPQPPPVQQPAEESPKKDDGLTGDRRLAKWILGKWTSAGSGGTAEWDFFLPLETSGQYAVKIFAGGRELGSYHGQWFIAAGQLTMTVQLSFFEPVQANTSQLYKIASPTADEFWLKDSAGQTVAILKRKK